MGYLGANGDKTVTLGFTPQFLLIKRVDGSGDWIVLDRLQGMMNQDTASGYGSYGNYYWKLNRHDIQSRTNTKFRPEIHADGFTLKVSIMLQTMVIIQILILSWRLLKITLVQIKAIMGQVVLFTYLI